MKVSNTDREPTKYEMNEMDVRRERSREAARTRRKNESQAFTEICKILPVSEEILNQLDRAAIIRVMISYLKLRNTIDERAKQHPDDHTTIKSVKSEFVEMVPSDAEYVNAFNGFFMVLSDDYDVLYVTESVEKFIGVHNFDLIGQSLLSVIHEGDHSEVTDCLKEAKSKVPFSLMLRMRSRSHAAPSGRHVHVKSSTYKVIKCEGVIQKLNCNGMILLYCESIPHPANLEMYMDSKTFLTQHSLDMKFLYCDEQFNKLFGFDAEEMKSKSIFDLCHTADLKQLERTSQNLLRLGQATTETYRVLAKYGGYRYVFTQSTVINNPQSNKANYIISIHHIISAIIDPDVIMSLDQLKYSETREIDRIKEEFVEVKTEGPPINLTDTLFSDAGSKDELVYNSTDDMLAGEIPSETNIEAIAKNSSSIQDDFDFANIDFNQMLNEDIMLTDIFNAAPSIGDPPYQLSKIAKDIDKLSQWFFSQDYEDSLGGMQSSDLNNNQTNKRDISNQDIASFADQVKISKNELSSHLELPKLLKRKAKEQTNAIENKQRKTTVLTSPQATHTLLSLLDSHEKMMDENSTVLLSGEKLFG